MNYLAFYKGRGNWIDAAIRWVTRSRYSHVELVISSRDPVRGWDGESRICYTSSPRDGGVKIREITFNEDHWDFVPIKWRHGDVVPFFRSMLGGKYDYRGIFLTQLFNLRRDNSKRWFCSEIVAASLGMPRPSMYSPGDLKETAEYLNSVCR